MGAGGGGGRVAQWQHSWFETWGQSILWVRILAVAVATFQVSCLVDALSMIAVASP